MRKTILLSALFCLTASHAQAEKPNQTESHEPYVGVYSKGSVDSIFQLAILPNRKFCLTGSAGALDLRITGDYQAKRQGQNYHLDLKQENFPASPFTVFGSHLPLSKWTEDKNDTRRTLLVHVPSISYQTGVYTPVGFGANKSFPANFKILAKNDGNARPTRMRIPLAKNARYLFIGHIDGNQLYRFDIGTSRSVLLSAATHTGKSRFEAQAIVDHQSLQFHNAYGSPDIWRKQSIMSSTERQHIEEYCFSQTSETDSYGQEVQAENMGKLSDHWQDKQAASQEQWLHDPMPDNEPHQAASAPPITVDSPLGVAE